MTFVENWPDTNKVNLSECNEAKSKTSMCREDSDFMFLDSKMNCDEDVDNKGCQKLERI